MLLDQLFRKSRNDINGWAEIVTNLSNNVRWTLTLRPRPPNHIVRKNLAMQLCKKEKVLHLKTRGCINV